MGIVDAYAERKYRAVMQDTWGHLAPQTGTTYKGFVLFAHDGFSAHLLLDFDFAGLDGNPWTMEHVSDWWSNETKKPAYRADIVAFWRWEGTYRVFKNERYQFSKGQIETLSLSSLRGQGA